MDLIPNGLYQCSTAPGEVPGIEPGLYRVVLCAPSLPKAALVYAQPLDGGSPLPRGGRRKLSEQQLKRPRKKTRPPSVGQIYWLPKGSLQELWDSKLFRPIELDRPHTPELSAKGRADYERRLATMGVFLDLTALQRSVLTHGDLRGLVRETLRNFDCSRAYVYKLWSLLCRFGFTATSLWPQRHRCGAPGQLRRCGVEPGSTSCRRKAGRRTLEEGRDLAYGKPLSIEQPGMTRDWAARILAADGKIPVPKPKWPERCIRILSSAFCSRAKEQDGKLILIPPERGTYPNERQIRRVIKQTMSEIDWHKQHTTEHHFVSARRGLAARNWAGVPGPGHTWIIDSTVGDIYLRSSVDRAWVIGRPIVYVVVDVWSTAVMGFYVCLTGPSWNTSKVSLFCAALEPGFVGSLLGYQPLESLYPSPTLCHTLLCDRGENHSEAHRQAAKNLGLHTGIAPPHRGDLKGLGEVLHRIEKDATYHFWPGAMDYRREELELRKVDPNKCTLTLHQYVQVLHSTFTQYNLFADRTHRMDVHMTAAGIHASPAGLWHFGHQMGIGHRMTRHFDELATNLLHRGKAWVSRSGVRWAGNNYSSEVVQAERWTTLASLKRGWELDAWYFPGSMGQIWVPHKPGGDLIRLDLTDESRATSAVSTDEWLDVAALEQIRQSKRSHDRFVQSLIRLAQMDALRSDAAIKTAAAIDRASGRKPSMSEARLIELTSQSPHKSERKTREVLQAEAFNEHDSLLADILRAANKHGGSHVKA